MTYNQDQTNPTKWDVALEALAKEEAKLLSRDLQIDDFVKLAREHAIRFDDIMVTMFELVLQGHWAYLDESSNIKKISRDEINNLYVNGRLNDKDVQEYDGYWRPYYS